MPRGSALDREALRRGNSVYFPDRAIPMLPERLSGDLCSLRAGVDRPALVVRIDVAADGKTGAKHFQRGWIRSRAGLHYEQAAAAMAGDAGALPDPALLEPMQRLAACARALEARRAAAGAVDFDLPSPALSLDADGKVLLRGHSDAQITTGFAGVLAAGLGGLSPEDVLGVDDDVVKDLGLGASALPRSRANGFRNMLESVKKQTRLLRDGRDAMPFPSLLVTADGIEARGPFAEAQANYLEPDAEAVAALVKEDQG